MANIYTGITKVYNVLLKSWAYAKVAERTGMSLPEIELFKECYKESAVYYTKKLSIFLKSKQLKRKAAKVELLQQAFEPKNITPAKAAVTEALKSGKTKVISTSK